MVEVDVGGGQHGAESMVPDVNEPGGKSGLVMVVDQGKRAHDGAVFLHVLGNSETTDEIADGF